MTTDWLTVHRLAAVARVNPNALRLFAQLLGVPPCPVCDYIASNCRCDPKFPGDTTDRDPEDE